MSRPRPVVTELTEPFWAAARRHVLVRPVCSACRRSFFTPQIACPRCISEDWSYEPSSGRGTVYSSTVVHRAPYAGFAVPYEIAMVDLEEGWGMLSELVSADDAGGEVDVHRPTQIGTAVVVDWLPLDAEIVLPVFRPTRSEAVPA